MDRRRFLKYGAAAGVAAAVGPARMAAWASGPRAYGPRAYAPVPEFPSGVISGDPASDGVVLWTRIDPATAGGGTSVAWEVATDAAFAGVVASGTAATSPATDHTVHVEVGGLTAATTYWYRFTAAGATSPVGRTRTLPAGSVDRLRIAFFSCERYVHGYYTAHADLAALAADPAADVDLVICLGDYVYEAGPADDVTVPGRTDPDAPQVSLDDFRRQYHLYRTDLDLQAVHAAYPFVGIFDNHDGMSSPTDPSGPGARDAFFEQMPVRRVPADQDRQYRSFRIGDLAELFLLDERQYRDPQPEEIGNALGTSSVEHPEMVEPGRTMLGAQQLTWLTDGLAQSTAAWKIIGSQLMFAPLRSERFPEDIAPGLQQNAGRYVNLTQWDGYQDERRRLLQQVHDDGVEDVLVISGDTHFWTTSEVQLDYDDADSPYVLCEFGGSSVTSANAGEQPGLPGNDVIRPFVTAANPLSLRFMDVETHGYGLIELSSSVASVAYRSPASITTPTSTTAVLARFEVDRGTVEIRMVEGTGFLPRVDPTEEEPPGEEEEPEAAPASPATPVTDAPTYTG